MKIVFNIKFVAKTSNIQNIFENIKSDVITSKMASLTREESVAVVDEISCVNRFFMHDPRNNDLTREVYI